MMQIIFNFIIICYKCLLYGEPNHERMFTAHRDWSWRRVPNRFFGIRDLAFLKPGIRDFGKNGQRDSGL